MKANRRMLLVAGLAGAAAGIAGAGNDTYLINGSGATLLEALFNAPASTNDFIDVDADGLIAIDGDQLAPANPSPVGAADAWWIMTYRVVGSGNGFAEMRDWGPIPAVAPDLDAANLTFNSDFSDSSLFNRAEFVIAGITQPLADSANPGATPVRAFTDGTYRVTTGTGAGTGLNIDFSAIDVPVAWFVVQGGDPHYNTAPTTPGYGGNTVVSLNKDGTVAGQSNKLKSLTSPNGHVLNTNTANPDDLTVFDQIITLTPVAAMVNYGVGLSQIDMSDLRHLMATGRRINGENLVAVTRDSGSGTRNAFANGICLDPSFCIGENIGPRTVSSSNDILGPNWQPSNKGGSSRVEGTVKSHRLAIGHTGAERGESSGWLVSGQADLLAVRSDLKGGTTFARPTLSNVLDGGVDGYNIMGPGVIATLGDPRSNSPAAGGWGWAASETGPYPRPVQPLDNEQAAAYVNNITRSISAFVALPGSDDTLFTPGEFLATQFLLLAATDFVPNQDILPDDECVLPVPNADLNQTLQDFILTQSGNVLGLANFQTFDLLNSGGLVPTRTSGVAYSDAAAPGGSPTGQNYVDQSGNLVAYASLMSGTNRNKIAGDFNNDGVRSTADASDMIAAWRQRHAGGPVWASGTSAVIEILGDFTGDGNFDAADVRYWADGLVLASGNLDRAAGFTAVDNAFGGNFFGTNLVTGTYDAGDSRADVSGPGALHTPGFNPIGQDGTVDMSDIDYVCANFGDWNGADAAHSLDDATGMDLSADMNGDLVVNAEDVRVIVEDILDSTLGDLNLDGFVDSTDCDVIRTNVGMTGVGYGGGDANCDGVVSVYDLACAADTNCDGMLDFFDVQQFLGDFSAGHLMADYTGDGSFDFFDVQQFLQLFSAGCN